MHDLKNGQFFSLETAAVQKCSSEVHLLNGPRVLLVSLQQCGEGKVLICTLDFEFSSTWTKKISAQSQTFISATPFKVHAAAVALVVT